MTTTLGQVRQALADAAAVAGVRVDPYLRDTITTPAGYVNRAAMTPQLIFGNTKQQYAMTVSYFFNRSSDEAGQRAIDDLCEMSGATSVRAAIETSANWPDDLVDYAKVTNVGETEVVDVAGIAHLSVTFDVEVVW